jgi:hypothetical protein
MRSAFLVFMILCGFVTLPHGAFAQDLGQDAQVLGEAVTEPVAEPEMSLDVSAADAEPESMDNIGAACTTPPIENLNTTDKRWAYCDIYTRQFAYRKTQLELRQKLVERAVNYNAIQKAARDRYAEALKAHHASLGEEGVMVDLGSNPFNDSAPTSAEPETVPEAQ